MKVIVAQEEANWKKIKPLQQNLKKKKHIYIFLVMYLIEGMTGISDWNQAARMSWWEEQEGSIPSKCVN